MLFLTPQSFDWCFKIEDGNYQVSNPPVMPSFVMFDNAFGMTIEWASGAIILRNKTSSTITMTNLINGEIITVNPNSAYSFVFSNHPLYVLFK